MGVLIENKKVFEYQVLKKIKAGIVLTGQEVKSIKNGRLSLAGSFVIIKGGEVFLIGATIPPYQPKNAPKDYNPQRPRKLLLKKEEIKHLIGQAQQKGLTMIPLRVYTENNNFKLEFGVAKKKKKIDKREEIKKREIKREIQERLKLKL